MANAPSFSLMFIIRNTRMVNGLAPIYARISVNTQRTEFAIKRNINPDSWNSDRGMAKQKNRKASQ